MPIRELRLISRDSNSIVDHTPFNGSSDIEFDEFGGFKLCDDNTGLEQNLLKAVITGVQPDGYGTDFKSLLGRKNTGAIRAKLMQETLSSIAILKKAQMNYLSVHPTYDKKNIIGQVANIQTNPVSKTEFEVNVQMLSLDDIEKNTTSLQSINTRLQA